jgi:hypothetical protein
VVLPLWVLSVCLIWELLGLLLVWAGSGVVVELSVVAWSVVGFLWLVVHCDWLDKVALVCMVLCHHASDWACVHCL